jgi:hypothetical protein
MAGKYGATGVTCSVYCYVLVGEGLTDEIRNDAAVKRMPATQRQVRREDAVGIVSTGGAAAAAGDLSQKVDAPASRGHNAHVGPVCVEDSDDAHACAVLAIELEAQGLADTLALVIASSDASAAHMTPVRLWLRMHVRIAVYLKQRHQDVRCKGKFGHK